MAVPACLAGSEPPANRSESEARETAVLERGLERLAGVKPERGHDYHATDLFTDPKVAQLAEAAADGDVARINALAARGASPNAKGREGFTPLMYSMSGRSTKGFKRLLEMGGDPNLQNERGQSAISFAASRHESESLKLAIAFGGDANVQARLAPRYTDSSRPTPIYDAIDALNPENARLLIKAGADLNVKGSFGCTPLMAAAGHGSYQVMYLLLESGADFRAKDDSGYPVSEYILEQAPHDGEIAKWRRRCMEFMEKKGVNFEEEKRKNADNARRIEAELERADAAEPGRQNKGKPGR
jgi:ankyrin repeat protein